MSIFCIGTAGDSYYLGIYADSSGAPGALLATTAVFTPVLGLNLNVPLTSTPTLSAGTYHVALMDASATASITEVGRGGTSEAGHYRTPVSAGPESIYGDWDNCI
jgi:hypothetical protein